MYYLLLIVLQLTILLEVYVVVAVIVTIPYVWVLVLLIAIRMVWKGGRSLSAYGTARWATPEDIPHLLQGSGLEVGQIDGKITTISGVKGLFVSRRSARQKVQMMLTPLQRKQRKQIVRLSNSVHTAVFAPPGAGKSTGLVIPFLLDCDEPAVVLDFKGELTQASYAARRRMGHRCVLLDPFNVTTNQPDSFNPLDWISESATAIDECASLANQIVVRTGHEKDPHWQDSAELWIKAMIAATVCFAERDKRNLQSVRDILTNPDKIRAAVKILCDSPECNGMLSRLGHQLQNYQDKELASTLTTTNRFMNFLDTIAVAKSTITSSFNPSDLLKGKMTVYIILPPAHMKTQAPLLRLLIGSMLGAVVKGGPQEKNKVHFVIDEAATLQQMDIIGEALAQYRGYGVRLQLYYQALGQLKTCFPDGQDQTLLSNTTQVFFGVNDHQTAEYVSNRLGEQTIVVDSGGTSWGGSSQNSQQTSGSSSSNSTSWNKSSNWSQAARKLLKPEEIATLSDRIAISFVPGCLPIWTTLIRWYEPEFKAAREIGLFKAMLHTFCLFLAAAAMATIWVGILFLNTER